MTILTNVEATATNTIMAMKRWAGRPIATETRTWPDWPAQI
jgi:hypothetical protein